MAAAVASSPSYSASIAPFCALSAWIIGNGLRTATASSR